MQILLAEILAVIDGYPLEAIVKRRETLGTSLANASTDSSGSGKYKSSRNRASQRIV